MEEDEDYGEEEPELNVDEGDEDGMDVDGDNIIASGDESGRADGAGPRPAPM